MIQFNSFYLIRTKENNNEKMRITYYLKDWKLKKEWQLTK